MCIIGAEGTNGRAEGAPLEESRSLIGHIRKADGHHWKGRCVTIGAEGGQRKDRRDTFGRAEEAPLIRQKRHFWKN